MREGIHLTLALQLLVAVSGEKTSFSDVSLGGCVVARSPLHLLTASSARMCAFLCSQLRPGCIGWSYRTGVCNVSDSVQTVRLTSDSDCQVWTGLRQLGLVAFWPMSNATRTRNVVSDSGHLDLQENMPMQYTDSAVNFTGQFDVNERFNVDNLTSVCLSSFTLSVWVKVSNPSRGSMLILEGLTMPADYFTRLWFFPDCTGVDLSVLSPASQGSVAGLSCTADSWTHIAAVYDRSAPTVRIYVNGTRANTTVSAAAAVTPTCANFGTQVQVGSTSRTAYHNRVFQGCMRCLGVSNKALGDAEVSQLIQLC